MMRVEEIEREIQKLDRVELAHLAQWFQNYASDMQDLAIIAERNDEPTESLDSVLQRLNKD